MSADDSTLDHFRGKGTLRLKVYQTLSALLLYFVIAPLVANMESPTHVAVDDFVVGKLEIASEKPAS
jgi:hypothetical protein